MKIFKVTYLCIKYFGVRLWHCCRDRWTYFSC